MIFERLCAIIAEQFSADPASITPQTSFEDDLGADSIDIVELSMALEEEFGIEEMEEGDVSTILTVGDLMKYLQARMDEM